eukprot:GHVS01008716.1.p1 GENE.GHVS01008716.1~~GHVS01008716.1.p1  ORF type:complete len:127 (+),score=8.34 GHVS01008716.1:659-1039(+)
MHVPVYVHADMGSLAGDLKSLRTYCRQLEWADILSSEAPLLLGSSMFFSRCSTELRCASSILRSAQRTRWQGLRGEGGEVIMRTCLSTECHASGPARVGILATATQITTRDASRPTKKGALFSWQR